MQPTNEPNKKRRKQLTSQDLKRRLYQRGIHGSSMPSLKNRIQSTDKTGVLYVNLNSSLNKRQKTSSPKILKKTASAFGQTFYNKTQNLFNIQGNSNANNNSGSQSPKGYFPKLTGNDFHIKKRSHFANFTSNKDAGSNLKQKQQQPNSPTSKTAINFYKRSHLRAQSEPSQQNQNSQSNNIIFNSSFYKNDSNLKYNQNKMTKRLVEKLAGKNNLSGQDLTQDKNVYKYSGFSPKNNHGESIHSSKSKSREKSKQKDQIIEKQNDQISKSVDNLEQVDLTAAFKQKQSTHVQSSSTPSLQQYIKLILKNVSNVDQFLYLVRRSKNFTNSSAGNSLQQQTKNQHDDNIYQLDIIDYQKIKTKDKQPNFQYYTISKKGFCHYYNGKPLQFIDLYEWIQEKQIYEKIKKLNFFNRFRRWKTIKMWIKKVIRHRIEKCSINLEEKLFILNPLVRSCILEIKQIDLQMEKSLSIISRNQGTYSLESFKHCQEKTRRQSTGIIQQFSHRSRQSVKKCFESNLQNLKQILKTKQQNQDKNFASTNHNPKDNAFQVLGFPAKMSYQHRSKLRKLTGRFIRFSYLVDMIHLNSLAGIFKNQIQTFSSKLNSLQVQAQVQVFNSFQPQSSQQSGSKSSVSNSLAIKSVNLDEVQKQKMFNIQLIFKPTQIQQYSIKQIEMQVFDISLKVQKAAQIFNPLYHIKQKQLSIITSSKKKLLALDEGLVAQKPVMLRRYVPNICDLWLTLKPTLDNIFDELSFLIKQSMGSLKYFQRWSKHRQMQKYINILQQWDDIVSQNWQISQNDNLDPISIIDNIQSSMSKIKQMIQTSQTKLTNKLIDQIMQPLNIYWQNMQSQQNVEKLLTNNNIQNSAETIQFYLTYMSQQIQKFQTKIPNFIQLGIFVINIQKTKSQLILFMKEKFQSFKAKLPNYVEEKTIELNNWLYQKSQRLREEIHNIDDFVKLNKSLKQIEQQFFAKKDLCNDLGHIYQTMYSFKIQTKKRKQFEMQTLKAKDQLQQYLINVQQNIQRKTQHFTRQVSRQHIPNLQRQIQKINSNISSQQFQSTKSSSQQVICKLQEIKNQFSQLKQKKQKCLQYLSILKLSQISINQLQQLQIQINSRLAMWQTLQTFNQFTNKIDSQVVNTLDLVKIKQFIIEKRNLVQTIEHQHNRPNNEILVMLKQNIDKYYINIPLLQGFNDKLLSENHWEEINQILKDYPSLDLRRKQFTLRKFIETDIGKQNKKIKYIFNKANIQNKLQDLYFQVESTWNNTIVKSKLQSNKFIIISNPEVMREAFDYMLKNLTQILSNPFSQTLKQFSITYDTLLSYYNTFQNWLIIQQKLLKIDAQCKLLDVKKLNDYTQFENCQKIYKNIMKLFSNRNVENGVKMSKLFVHGLDQKLLEMEQCLKKVEDNIKCIIQQHRKNYPPFYLFNDEKLFHIITQTNNPQVIESTAKQLIPCIQKIQFQGQRISAIYNFDSQKVHKNMISINSDIQQILLQITDTIIDINKKNIRSCRYKSVQTSLIKLIPFFQTQYLLAINKIDFSNYTQISIDNQVLASDSLKQFYKVMKKDIIQDLKCKSSIKQQFLVRYDTLILQNLYHQQLLSQIIKKNVHKTTDFQWQSQLRFYWQESSSSNNNNDDMNIIIKHVHAKLKYGNQYTGSRCKVIQNNSDTNVIFSLSNSEKAVYLGTTHTLDRLLTYIGYRMVVLDCAKLGIMDESIRGLGNNDNGRSSSSTNSLTLKVLTNFLVGNWYSQSICYYKNFNYVPLKIQQQLLNGCQLSIMKQNLLKKNLFNIKQYQKKQNAIFLSFNHHKEQYIQHNFRGQYRTISHNSLSQSYVQNLLKITKTIYDNQISQFLLKLFQMIQYFQEKSYSYDICLQDFLDNYLLAQNNTQSQGNQLSKKQIFSEFIKYIKPKIGLDNAHIFQQTVKIYLVNSKIDETGFVEGLDKKDSVIQSNQLSNKHHQKHFKSKEKPSSKRSSSRQSQQVKNLSPQSSPSNLQISKSTDKVRQKSKLYTSKPNNTHNSQQDNLKSVQDQQKYKQIKNALSQRNMIIVVGTCESKLHAIKNLYSTSHCSRQFQNSGEKYKLIQVFSFTQSQRLAQNGGIVRGYIQHYIKNHPIAKEQKSFQNNMDDPTPLRLVFYFSGLSHTILKELQIMWLYDNSSPQLVQDKNSKKNCSFKQFLRLRKIYIVIGTQTLSSFNYSELSSFYIINVELSHQYLQQIGRSFASQTSFTSTPSINRPLDQQNQKLQQIFMKFYTDTLLSTFQNWSIKDIKTKQKNVYLFLTHLKSLLPVKENKLLQAMVYCFIRVFSNLDADYIKLEFLVKKLLGEDFCSEDFKVYDLVYVTNNAIQNEASQSTVPLLQQGLIYANKYFQKFEQQSANNSFQKLTYFDYIITPQLYHYQTIMRRILSNTNAGIWIVGSQKSGKSSLYQIFKHQNYSNKSWLKLTLNDQKSQQNFKQRILNNLSIHQLNSMKSKINYQKSIFMIDDVNLQFQSSAQTKNSLSPPTNHHLSSESNNNKISSKITFIKQLLKYTIIQYPSFYHTNNTYKSNHNQSNMATTHNIFHKKLFNLQKTNFILAGKQQLDSMKDCTVPIELHNDHDNQSRGEGVGVTKTIFTKYLRNRLHFSEINDLLINDIVSTTFEICRKLGSKVAILDGLELNLTKYILSKFSQIKIKDNNNLVKEVQRYWVYLLQQQLGCYEQHNYLFPVSSITSSSSMTSSGLHSSTLSSSQQSIIYRQLKNLNLQEVYKNQQLLYSYLHTKDSFSTYNNKKFEPVKDIKRIFNIINQKIDKYNESQNKRYGPSFDFINFDQLVKKIIKISNNLTSKDYLLYGRKGMCKQSLIKLVSYLQGSNYKLVQEDAFGQNTQTTLKSSVIDIYCNTNITTMSSYILVLKIGSLKQIEQLKQFYYTDFEIDILSLKDQQKQTKISIKQKESIGNSSTAGKQQKNLSSTSKGSTLVGKTFGNISFTQQQYYIATKPRLTQQDSYRYRNAVRIVVLTSIKQVVQRVPLDIKQHLNIDFMQQIPLASIQQYNVKLLQVDQIKCTPRIPQLLSQIFNYQKQNLQLSLKSNDDCIRLFNSFYTTLKSQIQQEIQKYGRIIQLFSQMRKLHQVLELQVQQNHDKIKSINELLAIQQTEQRRQQKSTIQAQLHKKSTCLNKNQKIIEMLNMLIPFFKDKHSLIYKYIVDVEYFQECLVLAASYFTYLSEYPYTERRKILSKWYRNQKIPSLQQPNPIVTFLPLFNLYPEEFNAEPIDDLEDFYQNMAIIFNSIKPIIIKDNCKKGKNWLENVCSFIVVSQKQSNFVQIICQNLVKASNIMIQITNQQTLNNISTSFINTLLFLGQSTQTINIKGQQIKVSPDAKFYLLLGDGIQLPKQMKNQFAVVCFNQSQKLLNRSLEYSYMGICHPEVFYTQLDYKKKIRNLKLEQQALMNQIAENIYSPFDTKGEAKDNQDQQSGEVSQAKPNQSLTKKQVGQVDMKNQQKSFSKQQYQVCLIQLSDKIMTRGQNLTHKLKEKQQLCKDLQHKQDLGSTKFSSQLQQFIQKCKNILCILQLMSAQSKEIYCSSLSTNEFNYPLISHQQFVKKINLGLKRNFIIHNNHMSLYLFAIKIWGQQYVEKDFYVFVLFIFSMIDKTTNIKEIKESLHADQKGVANEGKNLLNVPHRKQRKQKPSSCSQQKSNTQWLLSKFLPTFGNMSQLDPLNEKTQTSSLQAFLSLVKQKLIDFLHHHFTYEQLIPYIQFIKTLTNLSSSQSTTDHANKIVINCVWVNSLSRNTIGKQEDILLNNNKSSLFSYSKRSSSVGSNNPPSRYQSTNQQDMNNNFLLSNNASSYGVNSSGIKIISLQNVNGIHSPTNLNPSNIIQNEIKKYLFEENILVINSIQILQITLQILRKLNTQQKLIYFKCALNNNSNNGGTKNHKSPFSYNKNVLQKVQLLSKKYNVWQLNYSYVKKNKLLAECLQLIEKQRQLKKMASVSNIKSMKSIAIIDREESMVSQRTLGGQQNNGDSSVHNTNNTSNSNNKDFVRQDLSHKKTYFVSSPQQRLRFTQQRTQKNILISQNSVFISRLQQITSRFKQILTKIFFIIEQQIYSPLNTSIPYSYCYVQKQLQQIVDYTMNLLTSTQQSVDVLLNIQEKINLMLKVVQYVRREKIQVVDGEVSNKLNQLRTILEGVFREQQTQIGNNPRSATSVDVVDILDSVIMKLDQVGGNMNQSKRDQSTLSVLFKRSQNIKFQQQFISHFKKYLQLSNQQSQLHKILTKAKLIYSSLKNLNQPIAIKRHSRKSINAIFRKQQIKERVFTGSVISTALSSVLSNTKKPSTSDKLKRVSKQSLLSNKKQQEQKSQNQSQHTQLNQTYLTQLLIQIEFKKIEQKISYVTDKIQIAIQTLQSTFLTSQNLNSATIYQSLQLILLLLQDKIPGSWLIIFPQPSIKLLTLSALIKKQLRHEEDIGFMLDKIKRSKHTQIDFNLIKYPFEYMQFYFHKKLGVNNYEPNIIYLLANSPTNEQLDNCEDYLKINNIQAIGWKFSSQPNIIDITNTNSLNTTFNNNSQKPTSSQGKIMTACYFIRKQQSNTTNLSSITNNLTPILVYETKPQKECSKPIMKVYANTKKNTNIGLGSSNGLALWLKEQSQ